MIREAIILSGGLGTRLRSAVPDLPKTLAPVAGHPFLKYVIDFALAGGVQHIVFSLGYKHEIISAFIHNTYPGLKHTIVTEDEPLGTGGAILKATEACSSDNVFIMNGDTLFKVDLKKLSTFHLQHRAACTLSLKPMKDFDRYGVVTLENETVSGFLEKAQYADGLINGGVYALNIPAFQKHSFPEKFSFETAYLEKQYSSKEIYGLVEDAYFIDIGIPKDFERANQELNN